MLVAIQADLSGINASIVNVDITAKQVLFRLLGAKNQGLDLIMQGMERSVEDILYQYTPENDIDFWVPHSQQNKVKELVCSIGGFMIISTDYHDWLSHDVYLIPCSDKLLHIDVTVGNLMVGPARLVSEDACLSGSVSKVFSPAAKIADLIIRPAFRGNIIPEQRLVEAVNCWQQCGSGQQEVMEVIRDNLGQSFSEKLEEVLLEISPYSVLLPAARAVIVKRLLHNPRIFSVVLQKLLVNVYGVLMGRNKPLGRYHRGLVVAIMGTDGSGKSTSIIALGDRLTELNIRYKVFYLGRGRGNFPGVSFLRNLVGNKVKGRKSSGGNVYHSVFINKAASWIYLADYLLRAIPIFFQSRILGKVVLCDRYCYDLALIPGHSAIVSRILEWLFPTPDINAFLTAPNDVLIARKQERSKEEIVLHQNIYQSIIDRKLAKDSLKISTHDNRESEVCKKLLRVILISMHG